MLKVVHRIAALAHDLAHEAVGLPDGFLRCVYEPSLNSQRLLGESLALLLIERPDIEALAPLLAPGELGLGLLAIPVPLEHSVVLRAEALPELLRAAPAAPSAATCPPIATTTTTATTMAMSTPCPYRLLSGSVGRLPLARSCPSDGDPKRQPNGAAPHGPSRLLHSVWWLAIA